jgi:hypothetical protein
MGSIRMRTLIPTIILYLYIVGDFLAIEPMRFVAVIVAVADVSLAVGVLAYGAVLAVDRHRRVTRDVKVRVDRLNETGW